MLLYKATGSALLVGLLCTTTTDGLRSSVFGGSIGSMPRPVIPQRRPTGPIPEAYKKLFPGSEPAAPQTRLCRDMIRLMIAKSRGTYPEVQAFRALMAQFGNAHDTRNTDLEKRAEAALRVMQSTQKSQAPSLGFQDLNALSECIVDAKNGRTIFMELVRHGYMRALHHPYALKLCGRLCMKRVDTNGDSVLHLAVKTGEESVVNFVLWIGKENVLPLLRHGNKQKKAPINIAIEKQMPVGVVDALKARYRIEEALETAMKSGQLDMSGGNSKSGPPADEELSAEENAFADLILGNSPSSTPPGSAPNSQPVAPPPMPAQPPPPNMAMPPTGSQQAAGAPPLGGMGSYPAPPLDAMGYPAAPPTSLDVSAMNPDISGSMAQNGMGSYPGASAAPPMLDPASHAANMAAASAAPPSGPVSIPPGTLNSGAAGMTPQQPYDAGGLANGNSPPQPWSGGPGSEGGGSLIF